MMTPKTLSLLLLASSLAFGRNARIAEDLERGNPDSMVNVIVQFRHTPTATHHRKVSERGGRHLATLDLINGAVYSVPAGALEDLANDPDVAYIAPDRAVSATSTTLALDYKLQAVNADIAQKYGWNGTGIGVAVIDSGIQDRPDLHGKNGYRVIYAQNFINNGSAVDTYGHGTHVAGIVAGNGSQSQGVYAGVAPNAHLINLMVLNNVGAGTDSMVIAAIQRAIQLKGKYNIRVINLSLGRPVFESYTVDPLCQAVEAAWKAGIVVVVAAGNQGRNNSADTLGYGTITAPGNDPYVITVGAMKTEGTATHSDDLVASYSSKGPTLFDHIVKPDIVAPGNQIVSILGDSAIASEFPANHTDGTYFILSGTSMATPMVSGAAALLLQQNPNLTPDQVKARLMKTAYKTFPTSSIATDPTTGTIYTSYYDIFTVGAGYLDIWAALNNSDVAPAGQTTLSPAAQYNSTTGVVSVNFSAPQVWSDTLLWGSNLVWGSNIFVGGTNTVWGSNLVWGSNSLTSFNLVWGTTLLWGSSSQTSTESIGVAIYGEK